MFGVGAFAMTNGTYNSFLHQIGYCKMQSYKTVSRSTSGSVPMFVDQRIRFGIGLSDENMQQHEANLCGACLNITHIENFYEWNDELTQWKDKVWDADKSFLAMVFDRCPDPICSRDFLDFDIYHPRQPVFHGNPTRISWHYVPCPVQQNEHIEYLICTSSTCNEKDTFHDRNDNHHYYWTLTLRNTRVPIKQVLVYYKEKEYNLRKENSWTWDSGYFDFQGGINITFVDVENKKFHEILNISLGERRRDYNGGLLLRSRLPLSAM